MTASRNIQFINHMYGNFLRLSTVSYHIRNVDRKAGNNQTLTWLAGFIEMLELLACKMTTKGKDGIVYLSKDELELVKKLSNFIRVNGVLRNGEVVKYV